MCLRIGLVAIFYFITIQKVIPMYLTQKIRIFPTKDQEEVLLALSENCRLIYNFALRERKDALQNNNEIIGYTKQQKDLPQIKVIYPRYKANYSKTLQSTLRKLDQDYQSFLVYGKRDILMPDPQNIKGKNTLLL